MTSVSNLMLNLLPSILIALLLITGIALMGFNRRHAGRGATLGIVGCVLLLIGALITIALNLMLNTMGPRMISIVPIMSLGSWVFQLGGIGMLIWAVVARRAPATPPQPPFQQPPFQQQPFQQQPFQQPYQQPGQQPGWQAPPQPPYGGGQGY